MDAFVDILRTIIWPLAIVWVSYIFRNELRGLLNRLSLFKYKDLEAKFEKELLEVEKEAKEAEKLLDRSLPHIADNEQEKIEQLLRIAGISPRAAIMEAWREVECALNDVAKQEGIRVKGLVGNSLSADKLAQIRGIPRENTDIYTRLKYLRNQAAHVPDYVIEEREARRYVQLAIHLAGVFRLKPNE
jgi:hypothetical protein